MRIMRQPVRADHRLLEGEHAAHIGLVHHPIDRAPRLQPLRRLAKPDTPFLRDVGEVAARLLRHRLRPGDQDARCVFQTFGAQDRRGGDIGIGVETDFLLLDCRGDFRQGFGGTSEIAHPGRLVVRDDDRHLRRLADMKALVEAVEHMLGLVTHMRRVDGAGRPQQLGERLDLLGRRMRGRRIVEPGRQADRPGAERFDKALLHAGDLVGAGRPVELGHRAGAQRGMADQRGGVDDRWRAVERVEIIDESGIGVIGDVAEQVERWRGWVLEGQRREADAAIAGNDGGDPLARLCRHIGGEERPVVMRVDIDKPGRDDKPRRIDLARARTLRHLADRRDAIPRDSDIGMPARPAGAIDHCAAAQDPIGHMTPLLPRRHPTACRPHR